MSLCTDKTKCPWNKILLETFLTKLFTPRELFTPATLEWIINENYCFSVTSIENIVFPKITTDIDDGNSKTLANLTYSCLTHQYCWDVFAAVWFHVYFSRPSSFVKAELAKQIIQEFPFLKDPLGFTGYVSELGLNS